MRSLIPLVFLVLLACQIEEDPESNSSRLLAYSYAETFVEKRLKSPKSAEFPGSSEKIKHTRHAGDWEYQISSWVESTNSFNAVIRTKFTCLIKFDKESDSVVLKELLFE